MNLQNHLFILAFFNDEILNLFKTTFLIIIFDWHVSVLAVDKVMHRFFIII